MRSEAENRERQPYEKPQLVVIELTAEEVLVTGCKRTDIDVSGMMGGGCLLPSCSVPPHVS